MQKQIDRLTERVEALEQKRCKCEEDDEEEDDDHEGIAQRILGDIRSELEACIDEAVKYLEEHKKPYDYIGPEVLCITEYAEDDDLESYLIDFFHEYGIHVQQYSSGNIRFRIQRRSDKLFGTERYFDALEKIV